MSRATTAEDVDAHTAVFEEAATELVWLDARPGPHTIRQEMRRVSLAAALFLALAAPALAQGPPVTSIFLKLDTPKGKARTHSCAKGGSQKQVRLPGSRATGDLAHKAVVACEQPPRVRLPGLMNSEFAILNALLG